MSTITFPLDVEELVFPLDSDDLTLPLDFDKLARIAAAFVVLVEIDWDGGTEFYSFDGVRPAGSPEYEDLLDVIGTISRESPAIGGEYRISDATVTLKNRDKRFSKKKATQRFYNIPVRIYFGDPQDGLDLTALIFNGRVNSWKIDDDGFLELSCHDIGFDRFNRLLTDSMKKVELSVFPNLPDGQKPALVPAIWGNCDVDPAVDLATYTGGGPVPCYLIDPNVGGKWRYVIAQHACKSVINLFVYGVKAAPGGYTVTTATYGGVTMTVADFNADPRISDRLAELEVTAAVQGRASGGVLIENPVSCLEDMLDAYASTPSTDLDTTLAAAAVTATTAASYKAAFVLIDIMQKWADVIASFHESFLLSLYATTNSKFGIFVKIAGVVPSTSVQLRDVADMLSFKVTGGGSDSLATSIQYNYEYQWVREFFEKQPSVATGESVGGDAVPFNANLWYVRDATTAAAVKSAYVELLKENVQYQEIEIIPDYFRQADLNAYLGITHWAGIASDGNGYNQQTVRVIGMDLEPQPDGMKITLKTIRMAP